MQILKILKISIMQSKSTKYRKNKINKNENECVTKQNTSMYKKAISKQQAEMTETFKQSNRHESNCSLVPQQEKASALE